MTAHHSYLLFKINFILESVKTDKRVSSVEDLQRNAPSLLSFLYESLYAPLLIGLEGSQSAVVHRDSRVVMEGLLSGMRDRFSNCQFLENVSSVQISHGALEAIEIVIDLMYATAQMNASSERKPEEREGSNEFNNGGTFRRLNDNSRNLQSNKVVKKYFKEAKKKKPKVSQEVDRILKQLSAIEHQNATTRPKQSIKKKTKLKSRAKRPSYDKQLSYIISPLLRDRKYSSVNNEEHLDQNVDIDSISSLDQLYEREKFEDDAVDEPNKSASCDDQESGKITKDTPPKHRHNSGGNQTTFDENTRRPNSASSTRSPILDRCKPKQYSSWGNQPREFVYDVHSGRRVSTEEMAQIKKYREDQLAKYKRSLMSSESKLNDKKCSHSATASGYPNTTTAASVRMYLKKMELSRSPPPSPTPKSQLHSSSRNLKVYGCLENGDMLLTIEHCSQCESHEMSLRHNPNEYISQANQFLKDMSRQLYDYIPVARVGVLLHGIANSRMCASAFRVGAFEIQIAYRNNSGCLSYELLHSKLMTSKWPSKLVIEKRLVSFLSKCGIDSLSKGLEGGASSLVESWHSLQLAESNWCYEMETKDSNNIVWLFDWKSINTDEIDNNEEALENDLGQDSSNETLDALYDSLTK